MTRPIRLRAQAETPGQSRVVAVWAKLQVWPATAFPLKSQEPAQTLTRGSAQAPKPVAPREPLENPRERSGPGLPEAWPA